MVLFYSLYIRVSDYTVYFHRTHLTMINFWKKKYKIGLLPLSMFSRVRFVLHHFDMHNRKASGLAVRLIYSLSILAKRKK